MHSEGVKNANNRLSITSDGLSREEAGPERIAGHKSDGNFFYAGQRGRHG